MPKRAVPTCACTPRPTRRSNLVSPLVSSAGYLTPAPNTAFPKRVVSIADILNNRIDASIYSYTQLSWLARTEGGRPIGDGVEIMDRVRGWV